jgi:hypothetical protein
MTSQLATTEPVALTTGERTDTSRHDDVRPTAATACWAALRLRLCWQSTSARTSGRGTDVVKLGHGVLSGGEPKPVVVLADKPGKVSRYDEELEQVVVV